MPFFKPETDCPLCFSSARFRFIIDKKNNDGLFSLYQCSCCSGQFWLPFKNPGADWYEKNDSHNIKDGGKPRPMHAYHKKFLSLHTSLERQKSLDLGCGTGEFMAEIVKRGAEVYGADFDAEAVKVARNNFGFKNIFNLDILDFLRQPGQTGFDIISLFEVFEHTDAPLSILSAIKKSLKSGGKLVMSAPGRERPLVNSSGWDFPFHHLSRWDEESLKKMLLSAGFREIKFHYINKFGQLYEVMLEILARFLKFGKAKGLKKISNGENAPENKTGPIRSMIIKIIYKVGRYIGVVILPYLIAAIFYPFTRIFYPRSGIIYIEAR